MSFSHDRSKPIAWKLLTLNTFFLGVCQIDIILILTIFILCFSLYEFKTMTVLLGAHSLENDMKNAQRVKVQSFHIPKTFTIKTKVDDIMLLKVKNVLAQNKFSETFHKTIL